MQVTNVAKMMTERPLLLGDRVDMGDAEFSPFGVYSCLFPLVNFQTGIVPTGRFQKEVQSPTKVSQTWVSANVFQEVQKWIWTQD